jgi:hypothetical protein
VWITYQRKHPTILKASNADMTLRNYSFFVTILKRIYQSSADTSGT